MTGKVVGLFTSSSPQTLEQCIALRLMTATMSVMTGTMSLGNRNFSAPF